MSACSAPPLIPSADQGRCPYGFPPSSTNGLRMGQAFGPRLRTLQKPKRHKTVRSRGIHMKEMLIYSSLLSKLIINESTWVFKRMASANKQTVCIVRLGELKVKVWKLRDKVKPQAYWPRLSDTWTSPQLLQLLPAAVLLDKLTPTTHRQKSGILNYKNT